MLHVEGTTHRNQVKPVINLRLYFEVHDKGPFCSISHVIRLESYDKHSRFQKTMWKHHSICGGQKNRAQVCNFRRIFKTCECIRKQNRGLLKGGPVIIIIKQKCDHKFPMLLNSGLGTARFPTTPATLLLKNGWGVVTQTSVNLHLFSSRAFRLFPQTLSWRTGRHTATSLNPLPLRVEMILLVTSFTSKIKQMSTQKR